jgi:hypothetical protein
MYAAKAGGRNRVVVAPADGALAGAIALKATLDDVAAIPPFAA